MFDSLKIKMATSEMEKCVDYLGSEICAIARRTVVDEMINMLKQLIMRVDLSPAQIAEQIIEQETQINRQKRLTSHRDIDYASLYVLHSLFTFMVYFRNPDAKRRAMVILDFLQRNADQRLLQDSDVSEMFRWLATKF